MAAAGWTKPYLAAEAGARFSKSPESPELTWGSKYEPTSSVKATDVLQAYQAAATSASSRALAGAGNQNGGGCAGLFLINYGEHSQMISC